VIEASQAVQLEAASSGVVLVEGLHVASRYWLVAIEIRRVTFLVPRS
jgi:hypothetical protein